MVRKDQVDKLKAAMRVGPSVNFGGEVRNAVSHREEEKVNRNAVWRPCHRLAPNRIFCERDSVSRSHTRLVSLRGHIRISRSGPKEASAYDGRRLAYEDLRQYDQAIADFIFSSPDG